MFSLRIKRKSKYQGNINWRKVAAAGVKFAMLRAVSTNKNGIYIDPTFEQNYKGARENGIPVGVYFFTYAQDEATQNKEFEMLFKALDGKTLQYPVALDIEDKNTASIGKDKLTALVKRGLDTKLEEPQLGDDTDGVMHPNDMEE